MPCAEVGLVVHFCLSGISLVSCYLAVRHQLPMDHLLELVGKHPEVETWKGWEKDVKSGHTGDADVCRGGAL